jgi:hypothetical protein
MLDRFAKFMTVGLAILLVLQAVALTKAGPEKSDALPDLTVKSLVVKGGQGSVTIRGDSRGVGMWMVAPNGDQIAITGMAGHPNSIALYAKRDVDRGGGATLAFAIDERSAIVQIREKGGKLIQIPVEKLARAAAWLTSAPKDE